MSVSQRQRWTTDPWSFITSHSPPVAMETSGAPRLLSHPHCVGTHNNYCQLTADGRPFRVAPNHLKLAALVVIGTCRARTAGRAGGRPAVSRASPVNNRPLMRYRAARPPPFASYLRCTTTIHRRKTSPTCFEFTRSVGRTLPMKV